MEKSTGILVYRIVDGELQVLLGKCGGPSWKNRSIGSWNIPKGHITPGETDLKCAFREFKEETSLDLSFPASCDEFLDLGETIIKNKKIVKIFAIEHDFKPGEYKVEIKSNLCDTEWPPKSGNIIQVPELEEAYYFKINVAYRMIFPYQKCFLERLENTINNQNS